MDWITANWISILAVIGGIDGLLYLVTKLTKSTWDDNLYASVHGWVTTIINLFQKKA